MRSKAISSNRLKKSINFIYMTPFSLSLSLSHTHTHTHTHNQASVTELKTVGVVSMSSYMRAHWEPLPRSTRVMNEGFYITQQ